MGAPYLRSPVTGTIMLCPVCRDPMIIVEFGNVELDTCVGCRGLWFDAQELGQLFELAGASRQICDLEMHLDRLPHAGPRRTCPRCRSRLEPVRAPSASPETSARATGPGRMICIRTIREPEGADQPRETGRSPTGRRGRRDPPLRSGGGRPAELVEGAVTPANQSAACHAASAPTISPSSAAAPPACCP